MARLLHSQSHLVVADPRPIDYRHLAEMAGDCEWHVHLLTSGAAAIQFARRSGADLWMVNVHLSDMSGFDLLEMLRDTGVEAPILIVADHCQAEDERHACRCGASLYLCKDADRKIDCQSLLEMLIAKDGPDSKVYSAGARAAAQSHVTRAAKVRSPEANNHSSPSLQEFKS